MCTAASVAEVSWEEDGAPGPPGLDLGVCLRGWLFHSVCFKDSNTAGTGRGGAGAAAGPSPRMKTLLGEAPPRRRFWSSLRDTAVFKTVARQVF